MITPPAPVIVHIIPTPRSSRRRPKCDKLGNHGFQVLILHTMPSPPGRNKKPARCEYSYGGALKETAQMVSIARIIPAPKSLKIRPRDREYTFGGS